MNRRTWMGLGAAVCAAAAGLAWWLVHSADTGSPGGLEASPTAVVTSVPPAPPAPLGAAPAVDGARREAGPARQPAQAPDATHCAQGVRGLVVGEDRRPLAGLPVYLVDSAGNDPLAMQVLQRQRDAFTPLTSTETRADGTFALGLPVAQDRVFEVYVTSPDHATARVGGLRLLAGQWHEMEAITMTAGATIRGRVTVAGRDDLPVPGASVHVETGGVFADAALAALPGAARGLVTNADAAGHYELRHVPSRGIVQVAAVAQGFARLRKTNIELRQDVPVQVDFGLQPGHAVGGHVVDAADRPVANARIEAWPQQSAGDPLTATSDESGRFEVLGLVSGAHRIRVLAVGYDVHEVSDVAASRADLRLVLHEQSRVFVRAMTPDGAVLRSYQLALRRSFADQNGRVVAVPEVPDQRVRLDGMTDFAELRGIPIGRFCCQIEADGFAKTFSEEFDNLRKDGAPPGPRRFEVTVTMSVGTTLRGTVVDEDGAPLAGAKVATQTPGTQPDHPLFKMLAGALPDRATATTATTAADGSFVFAHLALADYQLLVEHTDACRTIVPGVRLAEARERRLPPIRMQRGAVLTGRAIVGGKPTGQVKVVLESSPAPENLQNSLRLEAITDATGTYRMPRRVPPGNYSLRAAAAGSVEPEAQVFHQLRQMQRSALAIVVPAGQPLVERDIDLPANH